jgi:hypothetical protein
VIRECDKSSYSVADPHHFNADPDPTCHCDADPDPRFQIKAQHLEIGLKKTHIPYILACHLQIDLDPAYHFDADPDSTFHYDADPNPDPSIQIKAQNLE